MIERVLPDIFRIEIPLPNSPLKAVNSYVIKGEDVSLVIDTGFNRQACLDVMLAGLTELGVDLNKACFYITHSHSDHFGLISKLASADTVVYFNQPDGDLVRKGGAWKFFFAYAETVGFPKQDLEHMLYNHPGYKYRADKIPELTIVHDGDELTFGEYSFQCIHTPGHSKGHTCLYDAGKKILFSGDHILWDITPNITCWSDIDDPLQWYLDSLNRIYELEVDVVLPGHRRAFGDHRKRIEELKLHHKTRTDEVLSILKKGPRNGVEVAAEMTWDIDCKSWSSFPRAQKWFATGETMAHLRHLEEMGAIFRVPGQPFVTFALSR